MTVLEGRYLGHKKHLEVYYPDEFEEMESLSCVGSVHSQQRTIETLECRPHCIPGSPRRRLWPRVAALSNRGIAAVKPQLEPATSPDTQIPFSCAYTCTARVPTRWSRELHHLPGVGGRDREARGLWLRAGQVDGMGLTPSGRPPTLHHQPPSPTTNHFGCKVADPRAW